MLKVLKFSWPVLAGGLALIGVEAFFAWRDDFLFPWQLQGCGVSFALWQHGGTRADLFLVTPLVAWIVRQYTLPYKNLSALIVGVCSALVTFGFCYGFVLLQKAGVLPPEAYIHENCLTIAGYVHCGFAFGVFWVCGMFFLLPKVDPRPVWWHMMAVSAGLTALFAVGIRKFSPAWEWHDRDTTQVILLSSLPWGVTFIRLLWRRCHK